MKKHSLLALLIPLLLTAFTACASETPEAESETPSDPTTIEAVEEDTTDFTEMSFLERMKYSSANIPDNLPDTSFDGKNVKIWIRGSAQGTLMSELTGDNLGDATYNQKCAVEERFDVGIEYFDWATGWDESIKLMRTNLLSGDNFADIVENWNTSTSDFASMGFYLDLTDFACIDTTKPWFFGSEMGMYAYRGHHFVVTGFMNTLRVLDQVSAIFFNKDIAADYNIENLYDTVREGKWTADHVLSLCQDFYFDLNGNGQADKEDLYGMDSFNAASWVNSFPSLELPLMTMKEDGTYSLVLNDNPEPCQEVMDIMRELNNSNGNINGDWGSIYFVQGTTLFAANTISLQTQLRDVAFEYGILPPFKANEAQSEYCASYRSDPWAIPLTTSDAECSALIIAAYAVEGFRNVLPICYENTLKHKYLMDEDSAEMLDIMMNNIRGDSMLLYGDADYPFTMGTYLETRTGFSSFAKVKVKGMSRSIDKRIADYEKNLGIAY